MEKKRVYEIAKELHMSSKELVNKANAKGMKIKNHMVSLDHADEMKLRHLVTGGKKSTHTPKHRAIVRKPKAAKQTSGHRNSNGHKKPAAQHGKAVHSHGNSAHNNHNEHSNHQNSGNNKYVRRPKNFSSNNGNAHHRHNNKKARRFRRRHNRFNNQYTTNQRIRQIHKKNHAPRRKSRPLPKTLVYTDGMNAQDLGKLLHRAPAEIVGKLFKLGLMVNQNKSLNKDTIEIIADAYGIKAREKKQESVSDLDRLFKKEINNKKHLVPRPPVITIMGHVDHGKTTLLDYLRHSHVASHEAGGITQDIGAYQVTRKGKLITFLDTPGHAAFSAMRARGAEMTDLVILVVAADDGVMPQTVEAIHHAKAAKTPIIVAINKIDKAGANPKKVATQLTQYGLVPDKWGGNTMFVNISAKKGTNVDELLDHVSLQAEVMELKANPDQNAAGSVIEARLDQGKGSVATVLVQEGTMHVGDPIVVGNTFGRVRTMTNENGKDIKEAKPSTPVAITGLDKVPAAGDRFVVFNDEKTAREAGEERAEEAQMERRKQNNTVTLDNLFATMKKEDMKKVNLIVKADVQGSVEAICSSLRDIKVEGVRISIVHSGVGAINESDVTLAEASNAIVLGFDVRATPQANAQAESYKVDIRLYDVIYDLINEVKDAMKGMLAPKYKEVVTGDVEVRQLYKASAVGTIAGGMVTKGYIDAGSKIHLIRDDKVVYTGVLASLKRFKNDAKQVKEGFECGCTIENYNDIKTGDVIEAYAKKAVPRK